MSIAAGRRLFCAFSLALLLPPARAQASGEKWQALKTVGTTRSLQYDATATFLGKPVPVTLKFYCDTTRTKTETGALGFELTIANAAALKPFDFDSFEGPDAPAGERKLTAVTVARAGKPALSFTTAASGWSPDGPNFAFGVAEMNTKPVSIPKTVLRALADGADTFTLVITDAKNATLKLELSVPVGQKTADFKALLAGLK